MALLVIPGSLGTELNAGAPSMLRACAGRTDNGSTLGQPRFNGSPICFQEAKLIWALVGLPSRAKQQSLLRFLCFSLSCATNSAKAPPPAPGESPPVEYSLDTELLFLKGTRSGSGISSSLLFVSMRKRPRVSVRAAWPEIRVANPANVFLFGVASILVITSRSSPTGHGE